MNDLAKRLADLKGKGYVRAPAGFGKTHLIAESVGLSSGRQLILTHTYAGVNALRTKLREQSVRDSSYHLDTIASWALRICLAYPKSSGFSIEKPDSNDQWAQLYRAGAELLEREFAKRIVHASYAGVFVDEYQDCSVAQHELVLALSESLPCRVLGDPLQGIFEFDDPIDWDTHVAPLFDFLGVLETPHRWKNVGTPHIGEWLKGIRDKLEKDELIDLNGRLPQGVSVKLVNGDDALTRKQQSVCSYFQCTDGHRAIAIHKGTQAFKEKCHRLARNLSGAFASIEEIEGNSLFSFFGKIDRARTNSKRLKEVVSFAAKCITAVNGNLPAPTKRGEQTQIRQNTRNAEIARKANAYLEDPSAANMTGVLDGLVKISETRLFRRDLFNRALGVLRKQSDAPGTPFLKTVEQYHTEFRHRGRPVAYPKLIGTTLLVKGLEFDHAIVLDASSLSKKELYVALTRGARSITIISSSRFIPGDGQQEVRRDSAGTSPSAMSITSRAR